jgi:hypothetical protein
MARRIDGGSLVFWHSPRGLTFWLDVHEAGPFRSAREAMDNWKAQRSRKAFFEIEEQDGALIRYGYRLAEKSDDARLSAFYGHVSAPTGGHVVFAAYFDHLTLVDDVLSTWRSIAWSG